MALSLEPRQLPQQSLHTISIDEIIALGEQMPDVGKPLLEHYFSPTKKQQFTNDYRHYLNSSLLEAKHGYMDKDRYLVFVITFQFVGPLLEIPLGKELKKFRKVLKKNYNILSPDLNLHFTSEEYQEGMLGEEEAVESFREELDSTYDGRRDVKDGVQKRLKQDALSAIADWQKIKGVPELAEAFGRSIVIPSFFNFSDKKLVNFYRKTTAGINYEVMVPDFTSSF